MAQQYLLLVHLLVSRIVLAACSDFLRDAFLELPQGLMEFTLVLPGVKRSLMAILVDFLYTGKMSVARTNSAELQQLVRVLKIDPDNVTILTDDGRDVKDKKVVESRLQQKELVQSKITSMLKANSKKDADKAGGGGNNKAMPLRAKRRLSQESAGGEATKKIKGNLFIIRVL